MIEVYTKRILYFPIIILLSFLVFTEILVFIGPEKFNLQYPVLLFFYLVLLNLALYIGYKKGIRQNIEKVKTNIVLYNSYSISDLKFVHSILILALVIAPIHLVTHWGLTDFSLSSVYNRFMDGIYFPADVYSLNIDMLDNKRLGTALTLIFAFLSPITFGAIPLGMAQWIRLTKRYKVIVLALILIEIVFWIGIGTRKGLLDLILVIPFIIIGTNPQLIDNPVKRKKLLMYSFVLIAVFVFYFVYSNLSRYSIDLDQLSDLDNIPETMEIKPFYENNVSPLLYYPLLSISDYLCQGYYALSCALKLSLTDPVFTYGYGNNTFIMVFLDRIFGFNYDYQMSQTYQELLFKYYDIHPSVNWHSLYVWLANDFTFIGVPFVVFIIGKFLAITWHDTLNKINLFAAPLFGLFSIMVFYSFANNQVLSSQFMAFLIIFILYKLRKHGINEQYLNT